MKQDTRETLHLLRIPLAALALAILVSLGVTMGSKQYLQHAQKELVMANNRIVEARTRLDRVTEEEREIRVFHPRYLALQARGLDKEEHRLDWVEGLREIVGRHRLTNLSYEISPRQPFAVDIPIGNTEPRASHMSFSLPLLHEGDLLRLVSALEEKNMGRFVLQTCNLERVGEHPLKAEVEPRLRGECALDWVTLSFKDTKQPGS